MSLLLLFVTTGAATAAPATVVGTGAVPAPTGIGDAVTAPATVAGIGAVPDPVAFGTSAGTAAPTTTAGIGAVPAPTASGAATSTPSATAGVGAVPAPTALGAATASPSAVAGIGAVPAATAFAVTNGTATPTRVVGIGAVPAATAVMRPANDNFADAVLISGLTGTTSAVEIRYATVEVSEPGGDSTGWNGHHVNTPHQSIWYKWIAPSTTTISFDTRLSVAGDLNSGDHNTDIPPYGALDTRLAVFTGTALNNLVLVASNDDVTQIAPSNVDLWSVIWFNATNGTTYWIQVSTYVTGYMGTAILAWPTTAGTGSPSNVIGVARIHRPSFPSTVDPGGGSGGSGGGGSSEIQTTWVLYLGPSDG